MLHLLAAVALAFDPFEISLVDAVTGDPAPCVDLVTIHGVRWTSDVDGKIAFVEPGLMDRDVWFYAEGPGYGAPADGFGFRGVVASVTEGGATTIPLNAFGVPAGCTRDHHTRLLADFPEPGEMHRIEVVDAVTGRPVPLVGVETPFGTHWTDSAGNIAVYDPDLVGVTAEVTASSHGYAPVTTTLDLAPGGHSVIAIARQQIAERLYRITGQGIYRDTTLLGLPTPLANPNLAGTVLGQDSALAIPWGGRLLWIWGDTNKASYPLGLFAAAGAWVDPPSAGGLSPDVGVDLEYLVGADGFARAMAPSESGLATWLGALSVVDDGGTDRLVALYGKFASLTPTEVGVVTFDDALQAFRPEATLPLNAPFLNLGHTIPVTHDGERFLYDLRGYRVRATLADFTDASRWEAWSPATGGWLTMQAAPEAGWADALREPDTGELVDMHNGTAAYNAHRGRYLHLFTQNWGASSLIGEIWLAEADTPFGPWLFARKVITHDEYSFYNVALRPFFDEDGGRTVYFEGTYTTLFTGIETPTPRYDYNQLMYRLDLDDPRLAVPVPVYRVGDALRTVRGLRADDPVPVVAFHALDRPIDGALPVWWDGPDCADRALIVGGEPPGEVLFHVLPADDERPGTVALRRDGDALGLDAGDVIGRVWSHAIPTTPPVLAYLGPRVDAGPDVCASADGSTAAIAFTASTPTGGAVTWSVDGQPAAEGASASLDLPVGRHRVLATWTDGDVVLTDEVQVEVAADPDPGDPPEPGAGGPGASEGSGGCGCGHVGRSGGWIGLVVLALARRRRG